MALSVQEINRKLFHLAALLLPAGIFFGPRIFQQPEWIISFILAVLTGIMLGVEMLRFHFPLVQSWFQRSFNLMLRSNENRLFTGSTWYLISALTCSIIFYGEPHISFMALTMFIVGDAAAALVGLSFGRTKLLDKSLEGSVACFAACALTGILVFPLIPFLLEQWQGRLSILLILIVSILMTLFELIPLNLSSKIRINDNLAVPIIGGIALKYLQPLC